VQGGAGRGLGLPIVAAIAGAHDATIAAHARSEGGLCIQVSFPTQPRDAARTAEPCQLTVTLGPRTLRADLPAASRRGSSHE